MKQRSPDAARGLAASLPYFDAKEVAAVGHRAMVRGKAVVIPGFVNCVGAWLGKHAPLSTAARIVLRLQG